MKDLTFIILTTTDGVELRLNVRYLNSYRTHISGGSYVYMNGDKAGFIVKEKVEEIDKLLFGRSYDDVLINKK